MQAKSLMSTNLVVVPPETPVLAVAELLAARCISAVPVVDAGGAMIGIVTEGDLIRRLADEKPGPFSWFLQLFSNTAPLLERFRKAHGAAARDVMTTNLVSVDEAASAEAIAQLMEKHQIRRVPVVREGKLVGLVSRADLLRAVLRRQQETPQVTATDDLAIQRGVAAAMREQPWVDTYWVYPSVQEGVVTFYGYARSTAMRDGLRVLAEGVAGVQGVQDKMSDMPLLLRAQF